MIYCAVLFNVSLSVFLVYKGIYTNRLSEKERALWLAGGQIKQILVAEKTGLGMHHQYQYKLGEENDWKTLEEALVEIHNTERSFRKMRLR